jgi:hypothetical protein
MKYYHLNLLLKKPLRVILSALFKDYNYALIVLCLTKTSRQGVLFGLFSNEVNFLIEFHKITMTSTETK